MNEIVTMKSYYDPNNKIAGIFFPNRCPLCQRVIGGSALYCDKCASHLPKSPQRRYAAGNFPCVAPFLYIDEYAEAVKRFKFGKKAFYARALADSIAKSVLYRYDNQAFDLVTCVPMHKSARRRRHFNQAELLARECAKKLGLPFADVLEKFQKNKPQHQLKHKDRINNVKGVFRVIEPSAVKDKRILLIDDIFTSGNTMGECARILKKAGCQSVSGAVVCATLK